MSHNPYRSRLSALSVYNLSSGKLLGVLRHTLLEPPSAPRVVRKDEKPGPAEAVSSFVWKAVGGEQGEVCHDDVPHFLKPFSKGFTGKLGELVEYMFENQSMAAQQIVLLVCEPWREPQVQLFDEVAEQKERGAALPNELLWYVAHDAAQKLRRSG